MDLPENGEPDCGGYGVEMEEVGLKESTTMGDRDPSKIAGVNVDGRTEERDRDRSFNVSSSDDPVEASMFFDAGIRDFYLPRDSSCRRGSCGCLVDSAVAESG